MKKLKKHISASFKFLCMIILLGTQTLLRGSWTHENTGRNTV